MAVPNEAGEQTAVVAKRDAETVSDQTPLLDCEAKRVSEWLSVRYAEHPLTLDTNPSLDLGIDSLEWLQVVLEIEQACGVRLDQGAIGKSQSLRDILLGLKKDSRSERVWTAQECLENPDEVIGEERKFWLAPLGATELAAARGIHALNWLLICSYFGMRVEGRGRLPAHGPFVIAPHHVSYLDSFALAAALDFRLLRETYWAAWTGVAFGPAFRVLRRLTHVVPIDPLRGAALSLAYGAAVLQRGHNLIWFPEGALSHSGELMPLKPGLGLLLARYPVPVVPVFVQGTREALPPGSKFPRPGRITVTFEQPLDPHDLERRGAGDHPQERMTNALFAEMERSGCLARTGPPTMSSLRRIE